MNRPDGARAGVGDGGSRSGPDAGSAAIGLGLGRPARRRRGFGRRLGSVRRSALSGSGPALGSARLRLGLGAASSVVEARLPSGCGARRRLEVGTRLDVGRLAGGTIGGRLGAVRLRRTAVWSVGGVVVSSSVMATALLRSVGPGGGWSAVVLELQRDGQVELAQAGDDALEVVPALAGDADGVTLDLRLDLRELVPDQLGDLLGDLLGQPATQADPLADLVAAGLLDLAPVEDLERQAAPDRLGLDEVLDRRGPILVVGDQDRARPWPGSGRRSRP